MIYIDAVRGSAAVTLSMDIGARIQIATSAMGRAYLTAVAESERNDILDNVRPRLITLVSELETSLGTAS